jgi:hypothetical protein
MFVGRICVWMYRPMHGEFMYYMCIYENRSICVCMYVCRPMYVCVSVYVYVYVCDCVGLCVCM